MTAQGDPDVILIERELWAAGSPSRAISEQRYLKSPLEFAGTTVPATRAIVTGWRRNHLDLTRQRLVRLVAALWDSPLFECRMAAVILLTDQRQLLEAEDAALVERLLRTSRTGSRRGRTALPGSPCARQCDGSRRPVATHCWRSGRTAAIQAGPLPIEKAFHDGASLTG